jgi:hypothetical protein
VTADTTPVRPRPAPADDDASDAEDLAGEDRRPRYAMWAGGITAFALVALALWGGAHLSVLVPGMRPAWLAGIVGVCLAWLVVAVLGWCAAELLKTHHRAMRAAAWRGTRRSARWAWLTGRRHGGRAVVWAGGRWQQRQGGGGPPSMFGRLLAGLRRGDGEDVADDAADDVPPADDGGPRWRLIGTDRILTAAGLRTELAAHLAAGAEILESGGGWVAYPGPGGDRHEWRYERVDVPAVPELAPPPPEPAPEPAPASGDQAGRVVYMAHGRLAGGTETTQ